MSTSLNTTRSASTTTSRSPALSPRLSFLLAMALVILAIEALAIKKDHSTRRGVIFKLLTGERRPRTRREVRSQPNPYGHEQESLGDMQRMGMSAQAELDESVVGKAEF